MGIFSSKKEKKLNITDRELVSTPIKKIKLDFAPKDFENKINDSILTNKKWKDDTVILDNRYNIKDNIFSNNDHSEKYKLEHKILNINIGSKQGEYCITDVSTGISEANELVKEREYFVSYKVRSSYFLKLESKGYFNNPSLKSFNNILIFDWDDTLMFTSEFFEKIPSNPLFSKSIISLFSKLSNIISPSFISTSKNKIGKDDLVKYRSYFVSKLKQINDLQAKIYSILSKALKMGDVYIISNASFSWINFSAQVFFPDVYKSLFSKIKIVSNRDLYEKSLDPLMWKIESFNEIAEIYKDSKVTNLLIIGDSELEINAGKEMIKKFNHQKHLYLKTIKFKANPSISLLRNQLELLIEQIDPVFKKIKSLSIVIGKSKERDSIVSGKTSSKCMLTNEN